MKQFVYPAVLYYFEEENVYTTSFPDVDIYCEGDTVEDSFIKAKNFLQAYCICSLKLNNKMHSPTKYVDMIKKYPDNIVLLVDCFVKDEDLDESNFNDIDDMFND